MSQVYPTPSRYRGLVPATPDQLTAGDWWFNTTTGVFSFYDGSDTNIFGGTYTKMIALGEESFGRPSVSPPTVVVQDNVALLAFTVDTDRVFYEWMKPNDYDSGDLKISIYWTNDGGVDDQNTWVTWQIDYQTADNGDAVSGSHANSPKSVSDLYTSASGWILHETAEMTIDAADFASEHFTLMKISAVTSPAPALTCDPHLVGAHIHYTAKRYPL